MSMVAEHPKCLYQIHKKMLTKDLFYMMFSICTKFVNINPLPCLQILGSFNSAANKDIMSKIWTNEDTII